MENVGPEANHEKLTRKPKHIDLEAILEPFWPYLGGLLGPFWASWDQLEPTQSDLEPSWSQLEVNLSQHKPNMSQHEPTWSPKTVLDGSKTLRHPSTERD